MPACYRQTKRRIFAFHVISLLRRLALTCYIKKNKINQVLEQQYEKMTYVHRNIMQCYHIHTLNFPPVASSDSLVLASTILFRSLSNLLPKSLNIVDPPDNTMFLYNARRQSIGQF